MKVRRNDLCPCGSGVKYKRCHLDAERARERLATDIGRPVTMDWTTMRMATTAQQRGFTAEFIAPADELNVAFQAEIGEGLAGREAAEALERYMAKVEAAMAQIAAKHSRGYWMHMTRRLPPQPYGNASNWTVLLYRRVLALGVLKHGQGQVLTGEFTIIETEAGRAQLPAELNHQDIVDTFALEYLAYEYTTASQTYRRIGKGAHLVVIDNDFRAVADDDLEDLLQDADRRVSEYGGITGLYGAAADREFPTNLAAGADTPLAVVATVPNTFGVPASKAMRSTSLHHTGPPNFIALPVVINGYHEALLTLADAFEQTFGVDPDVMLSVLWGLSMYVLHGIEESPAVEMQLLKTGYLMSRRGDDWGRVLDQVSPWVGALLEHFGHDRPNTEEARQITERGLAALTWSEAALADISLWDRLPFNLVVDARDFYLVDYSALVEMLADVFRQLGFLSGQIGNIKAANFEAAVAARGRAEGIEPWKEDAKLRHADGTERQIDVGFVVGDVLYAVECKAYAQNPKIDRGDWAARVARQDQLLKYLDQARTLAEFISAEREGRNYTVPAGVTRIEHVLCTPGVEFIWSREPELWLTDEIPRICTPDELMRVLTAPARTP